MSSEPAVNTPAPLAVRVGGVGLLGPGLAGWAASQTLLREPAGWQASPTVLPPPARLPPTERRRAGAVVKASIVVADEALADSGLDPAALVTVFTSSTGDPLNCHLLCEALASPDRLVSPTRFTNSVHNAAAGYWHIATRSMAMSTSLAAFDASFAAGLLEAAVQCASLRSPVLLVACDVPYPEPLHALRPVTDVLAVALLLLPDGAAAGPRLQVAAVPEQAATTTGHAGLDALVAGVPAARALPLLQALALGRCRQVLLEGLPGQTLQIDLDAPSP